jgi:hypothetical protein
LVFAGAKQRESPPIAQKRNALAPKKKTPAKAVTHVSLLCTRSASMSFFESVILLEGREL